MQPQQTTIQCQNCGTPNPVTVRRVIDAQQDPQGKSLLLSGQVNAFRCQNCGTVNQISSPLLYHDAEKELLIAFVPMDVAMRQQGQSEEKIIGDLMNTLTSNIPKENFKAYMFNPKRALTLQGLIEQVLEADGITKEMIDAQQERVQLIQIFLEAGSEDELIRLAQEHDSELTEEFFQTLTMMAQRLMQDGQQQVAGHLLGIQELLIEQSSYGAEIVAEQQAREELIESVVERIEELGEDATRAEFIDLALEYASDEDRLQAVVGLARPALDEDFFTEFSQRIQKAPAAERDTMQQVRDNLKKYIEQVDQQTRAMVQQKAQFLQALLNSPQYEQILRQNMGMVDDNFMTVLQMNVQQAEQRGDTQVLEKLNQIYEKTVQLLQSQMTPEMRFLNELLSFEDESAMMAHIHERASDFDPNALMEVMDAIENLFANQGRQAVVARIQQIRNEVQQVFS